jgi:hypothetical protein
MPRAAHNIGRQRSTRNAISINAMLTWRGKRLRSVRLKEGDEAANLADIAAIDRVLVNVLGYTGDIEAESKDFRREALFKRNDLRKAVMVVLREANGLLTTRQITERVMSTKGKVLKPGRLSKEWISRVRVVCNRLPGVELVTMDGCQAWERRG